jgi:hypothetical protein
VVANGSPSRKSTYPDTKKLSVDTVQETSICVGAIAAPERLGVVGAIASPAPKTLMKKELSSACACTEVTKIPKIRMAVTKRNMLFIITEELLM